MSERDRKTCMASRLVSARNMVDKYGEDVSKASRTALLYEATRVVRSAYQYYFLRESIRENPSS